MNTRTLVDFDTLLNRYSDEIFTYLWRMMRDSQDAEDALQETFLRAFRSFPRLKNHLNLRAWLYKIATNVAYTKQKYRARHLSFIADLTECSPIASSDDHERRDLLEIMLKAIARLPHKQQAALMLRYYQGLDYEEISTVLECSLESARANVYQAIKKLRNQLSEDEK